MDIAMSETEYVIKFDFDKEKVAAIRKIPSAWWHRDTKTWRVPIAEAKKVESLKKKFVKIDTEKMGEMPEKIWPIYPLPNLDINIDLKRPLWEYQKPAVAFNLKHKKTLNGDKMGLGKTTESIATVHVAQSYPCLVICTASKKLDWQAEFLEVAGKKSLIMQPSIQESWPKYHKLMNIDVFICNYESLDKYFVQEINKPKDQDLKTKHITFKPTISVFKSVIIDESHRLKDEKTLQTKIAYGLTRNREYVLLCTGTPFVNCTRDLAMQLMMIDQLKNVVDHIPIIQNKKGIYDSSGYERFLRRYCEGGTGNTNMKELESRIKRYCFFQREKSEVLKDLPPKIRQIIRCELSNMPEYKKAEKDFGKYLREWKGCTDSQVKKRLKFEAVQRFIELKSIAARGKIEVIKEYMIEIMQQGEKVLIFCYRHDEIDRLRNEFPGILEIHGNIKAEDRQKAMVKFNTDPLHKAMVLNYKSGGEGLNLPAAGWVGFLHLPWTFAACEQCEDRAHRPGNVNDSVQAAYFIAEDTVDKYCYDRVMQKKDMGFLVTGAVDDVPQEFLDELYNLFNQK